MTKVLILGGLGFLGRHLAWMLDKQGIDISIIDKDSSNLDLLQSRLTENSNVTFFQGDVTDYNTFEKFRKLCTKEFHYIFHFASPSSTIFFEKDRVGATLESINGTLNAIRFTKENRSTLIFPSSGSCYAESPNSYAEVKLYLEKVIKEQLGFKGFTYRIFASYGEDEYTKGDYASIIYQFCKSAKEINRVNLWSNGSQTRDFIYVDDALEAICLMASAHIANVDVCSGKIYSFNTVINKIQQLNKERIYILKHNEPKNYLIRTKGDAFWTNLHKKSRSLDDGIKLVFNSIQC